MFNGGFGFYFGQFYIGELQFMLLLLLVMMGFFGIQVIVGQLLIDSFVYIQQLVYLLMMQLFDFGYDFDFFGFSVSMVFFIQFLFDISNMWQLWIFQVIVVCWREFIGYGLVYVLRFCFGGVFLWRVKLLLRRYFFMVKVGQRRKKKERWKFLDGLDQFILVQV